MRVALIGPLPPELGGATPGGVATHQAHLFAGLRACDGLDVELLPTNVRGVVPDTLGAFVRMGGPVKLARYAWHVAPRRREGSRREVLANLLAYDSFLARPDVIHVQHPLERLSYVRQLRALEPRLASIPVVVTAHSFFGEHPDAVIHQVMAPNLAAATRVIAVSPHIAEQAAKLGVEPARIRVIRSGVDTDRFAPGDRVQARHALAIAATSRVILFVGNLEPRKQLDVLLRALQHVPGAQLVIVGTGASAGALDQTSLLHQLTRDLGLSERVRFVGRVDEQELLRWYAAADVFALPSSSEAQGIVALEAMACALPVVVSAVGGLLGTVDDGVSGFLVPSGDVERLAARLRDLLTDDARRAAMGAAAREKVVREFTWAGAVADTVQVYREVVCPRH